MKTTVVNLKNNEYDVYIGLGSKWGNKFARSNMMAKERRLACESYEDWFWSTDLPSHIHELRSKVLGCHCKPKRCHGDFLARVSNSRVPVNFI